MRLVLALACAMFIANDVQAEDKQMQLTPDWEYVADGVMGGVSEGILTLEGGARLRGTVSLENNGGFIQMAFNLRGDGSAFNARDWSGIEMDVIGNGEVYDIRLRTDQISRPWQSFRADFVAPQALTSLRIPFDEFEPHRIDVAFDPARLRRIGILAIGRVFEADVTVTAVRLYK